MKVTKTELGGVLVIEPDVFGDSRGYFYENYNEERYSKYGIEFKFVQNNISKSQKGTIRGLHYQAPDKAQTKLCSVISGRALDFAIDIRFGSPTFGKYVAVELSEANKLQLFIPKGFAHGFVVLSPEAVFAYKCDNYYTPSHDAGLLWNDPDLALEWQIPEESIRVSGKDALQPSFGTVESFPYDDYRQEKLYPKIFQAS